MIDLDFGDIAPTVGLEVQEVMEGNGSGTSDYEKLKNKPRINGTTLEGNKTLEELGITQLSDYIMIQGIL